MSYKIGHNCGRSGCPNKAKSGDSYCKEHIQVQRRQYDKQRGSSAERGYDAKWKKYREWYLRNHPLCRICEVEGKTIIATVIDHIVSIRRKGSFWDPNNHQALCKPCHDRKTVTEDGGLGK